MSHDGLPARAASGAREAAADRKTSHHRCLTPLVALGAVAALAFAACGTGASGSGAVAGATSVPSTGPASGDLPSSEASIAPSASTSSQVTLSFKEANASKIFGGGIVTDLGDGSTAVTIGVVAIGFTDPMPAEIVAGDCATIVATPAPSAGGSAAPALPSAAASTAPASAAPAASGEPAASGSTAPTPATLPIKLTDVAAGSSNTVVQIGLADLLASPSAVVIHKSAADATVVACADVTDTPLALPSDLPSALPSLPALPSASSAP